MMKLIMVLRSERINERGQKEFFVQSKENPENYNWVSSERLELIKSNPEVTLLVEMEENKEVINLMNDIKPLENKDKLYTLVKKTYLEALNNRITRSNEGYKKIIKFANSYLTLENINDLRVYYNFSLDGFKCILEECSTRKDFIEVLKATKEAFKAGKSVIHTYNEMLEDIKIFEEDQDFEEVESIKGHLNTCIKLNSNLIAY
ncbi:hypothetical protein ACSW9O_15215 (plasmid) [Clostridium perfringens]|nr:hypothetical protein [Clostridium perfringens]